MEIIGKAMAGHAFREESVDKRIEKYDNPLTDFVNLMIAQVKAEMEINEYENKSKEIY